jgi:cytochrome P450
MATSEQPPIYWDTYDREINERPYEIYRRLREELPLYRNDVHDFWAVSRYEDVADVLRDSRTYISGRGSVLEGIRSGTQMPKGFFIMEDDPLHRVHRNLVSRVFTPKAMNALEDDTRAFCAEVLDPLVGTGGFDVAADLGAQVPMRVISMLLGIPESDREAVRDAADAALHTEAGKPLSYDLSAPDNDLRKQMTGEMFADYVDWRERHPSDDLMTQLLQAEFEDEHGVIRRLERPELLAFVGLLAVAGNETTGRLITWTAKLLAEHPDQRRQLVEDPSGIANAIEEVLRFEPPGPHTARYVARDVEVRGQVIPEGSVMMVIKASANRDDDFFPDGDRFDVNRTFKYQTMTLGYGPHFCLGASLARMEGRVVLEEVLRRYPVWDLDLDHAHMSSTSTVRGWDALPIVIP